LEGQRRESPALLAAFMHVWRLANGMGRPYSGSMISRGDVVWLGVSSGVVGALLGGLLLGIGMDLMVNGQPLGLLMVVPAAPLAALPGWLLGRQLAKQLD